jgi:alkylresorcinol/alkylpyrone synthase
LNETVTTSPVVTARMQGLQKAAPRGAGAVAAGEACILGTATAVPPFFWSQEELKEHLLGRTVLDESRLRLATAAFDRAAVATRYAALPLPELGTSTPTISSLNYRRHATALGEEVAARAMADAGVSADAIDMIISVSCTGVMIPSMDAHLANVLGCRADVRRLPLTELGCAGGAAALARARDFLVGHPGGHVLVVAVELPSLSLQLADTSDDNIVSSALFGDGAAAVVLGPRQGPGLEIIETMSHLFPDSLGLLGLELRDDGFHSILRREVVDVLRAGARELVDALVATRALRRDDLSFFVLHTGGKTILHCLEQELALERHATQPSWDVLRRYGNQSSASVLFVLHEWMTTRQPQRGAHGLLAAFGPGFSAEMMLLQGC